MKAVTIFRTVRKKDVIRTPAQSRPTLRVVALCIGVESVMNSAPLMRRCYVFILQLTVSELMAQLRGDQWKNSVMIKYVINVTSVGS